MAIRNLRNRTLISTHLFHFISNYFLPQLSFPDVLFSSFSEPTQIPSAPCNLDHVFLVQSTLVPLGNSHPFFMVNINAHFLEIFHYNNQVFLFDLQHLWPKNYLAINHPQPQIFSYSIIFYTIFSGFVF